MPFLAGAGAAIMPALKEVAAQQVASAIAGPGQPSGVQQNAINGVLGKLKLKTSKPADPSKPGDVPMSIDSEDL